MGYWWIIRYINLWVIAVIMPIWRSCTDRVTSKANIFPICSLSIYSVVLVPIHPAIMHCITPVAFSDNNHLTRGVHFASRKCKTFPWMSLVINVEICRRANSGPPPPKFLCYQWRVYFKVTLTEVFLGCIFIAITRLTAVLCSDE